MTQAGNPGSGKLMILEKIKKFKKTSITLAIFALILILIFILSRGPAHSREDMKYGITFSNFHAQDLGLDWKEAYLEILDELEIEKLRLAAYWNEVEENKGEFNFKDLDWQIKEASKRDVDIILGVGYRLPRWPECHFPDWAEDMEREKRQPLILEYIEKTVLRYKDNPNIKAWQVENEPFLSSYFGECPRLDKDFLDQEIELVKSLDSRPVIVTDSGELSLWVPAARRGDIFGTTMYKKTYSGQLNMYVNYPIGPWFFHLKRNVTNWFADPEKWIVIELQGEPWGERPYQKLSLEEREKTMCPDKLVDMVDLARKSGFKELYLWGAEYWYWKKTKNNNPEMWEQAKKLFTQ